MDGRILVGVLAVAGGGCGSVASDASGLLRAGRIDAHRRVAAADGTEIDVWVIRSRAGDDAAGPHAAGATAVLLHPLLTDKCWFRSLGERLAADGWDVVLPDLRDHGASGGRVTWGAREKHDVRRIMDALLAEGLVAPEVYGMGASLGACVAIQYAAVDPRCRGVLALAPPTGVRGYVRCVWPLATEDFTEARVRHEGEAGGYDPEEASAVRAARELTCPLIVVHGRLDTTVPYAQPKAIYDAAAGPRKMIRLWADHGGVQMGCDERLVRQMRMLASMAKEAPPRRPVAGQTGAGAR